MKILRYENVNKFKKISGNLNRFENKNLDKEIAERQIKHLKSTGRDTDLIICTDAPFTCQIQGEVMSREPS